jgi:hypothetical protein
VSKIAMAWIETPSTSALPACDVDRDPDTSTRISTVGRPLVPVLQQRCLVLLKLA